MGDGGGCHPRDNIAMSWLSRELDLSHDFFNDLMIAREDQTEWLAEECLKHDRKIYILGKSFKPETNITTGSPSILLYNILTEKGADVEILDPHIDGEEYFSSRFLTAGENPLFFIGAQHEAFRNLEFPAGSIVMDPFRYMPDIEGSTLIKIGNNA
jgi:UDPglucose 6-dehydrogenase